MSAPTDLPSPIPEWRDRWDGTREGVVVLDLGAQPPSDLFPLPGDPEPDPRYPVRLVMGLGSTLLQLESDPSEPEEPLGVEPAALVRQAECSVADLVASEMVHAGMTALEYPSPHGGSWKRQLEVQGVTDVPQGPADLVVDVHGMMHDRDQRAALASRIGNLAPDGLLVMLIHNAASIMRVGMWNAVKSGHFAYYSTPALTAMMREAGMVGVGAWEYPLYSNGTTMLAFAREGSRWGGEAPEVRALVERETAEGITDPHTVARLGTSLEESVSAIRSYLAAARQEGLTVAGYGAASRTVSLLTVAGMTRADVAAIADAATAKHGRTMPVTRIPIVAPADLVALAPDRVLLFVPDLLDEVRTALPGIEAAGGRWVILDPMPREVDPA